MPKDFDPDELFSLDMEPEQVIKAVLDGAGAEGEVEMDTDKCEDES